MLNDIIEELKRYNIRDFEGAPTTIFGLALPNNLGINSSSVEELCEDLNTKKVSNIHTAKLWIAIHETGHCIIRTDLLLKPWGFAKMTPDTKVLATNNDEIKKLEAGSLFTHLLLGAYDRAVWEDNDFCERLDKIDTLHPDEDCPIFTALELETVRRLTLVNSANSGAVTIQLNKTNPMML